MSEIRLSNAQRHSLMAAVSVIVVSAVGLIALASRPASSPAPVIQTRTSTETGSSIEADPPAGPAADAQRSSGAVLFTSEAGSTTRPATTGPAPTRTPRTDPPPTEPPTTDPPPTPTPTPTSGPTSSDPEPTKPTTSEPDPTLTLPPTISITVPPTLTLPTVTIDPDPTIETTVPTGRDR